MCCFISRHHGTVFSENRGEMKAPLERLRAKKRRNDRQKPKKSKSGECSLREPDVDSNEAGPSARHHGASHKGERMNRWNEDNMRQAILEFNRHKNKTDGTGLPVRQIARASCVPYSTFRKRIMKQVRQ